jgi:hypothetical protein
MLENITEAHGMSWNTTEHHGTSRNMVEHHRTWWNVMEGYRRFQEKVTECHKGVTPVTVYRMEYHGRNRRE